MRVLLVGPYPPPHGGVQTHLVAIREHLRARGVPCTVVNITRHRRPDGDGIYYPKSAVELVKLLFQLDYDVVHLHFGGNLTLRLLALAVVCSLVPRVRTVLTFHSGGYPQSEAGRKAGFWTTRGFVLRRLDRAIGVNQELVDMFRRFGVPADRARLIQPHAFPAASSRTEAGGLPNPLRGFFGAHDPVLLTVGGLETEYGIPLQVEMMGRLRQTHPDAGLAIIGGGSLEREIRECIAATDYREHVLLCGDVPHASTLQAIVDCDVLLRTTLYDGDSIAVREALHVGTPVLATDNGMRPAGVRLISSSRPDDLAQDVIECLRTSAPVPPGTEGGERNLDTVLELYKELSLGPQSALSSRTTMAG
jgi:glycogen(starch) synthase